MRAAFRVTLTQRDDDRVYDWKKTYIVIAPNAETAMKRGYKAAFRDGPDNRHFVVLLSLERLSEVVA